MTYLYPHKVTKFTSNGTWTPDPRATTFEFFLWGGGGGGGAGSARTSGAAAGGSGGAAGGFLAYKCLQSEVTASSYDVTVGTGGSGGLHVGGGGVNANGGNGSGGNLSQIRIPFGAVLVGTNGGNQGLGGKDTPQGYIKSGGYNVFGFTINASVGNINYTRTCLDGQDGNLGAATTPEDFLLAPATGGGGGAGYDGSANGGSRASNIYNSGNIVVSGGTGGSNTGGAGGAGNSPSNLPFLVGGTGGGGGGTSTAGVAGAGGAGAVPGGGGGGGGASVNTNVSGSGGAGAAGQVIIIEYFG